MDLTGKKIGIFGIQGSGKTILARKLIRSFRKPIVYEVNPDFRNDNCMIYKPANLTPALLDAFCGKVKQLALKKKCDCFVIDEFDMFCQGNLSIPPNLNDLVLNHRHYGLAIIFISRRLQDIPAKIVESCHHLFVFKIEGLNAVQRLKGIHPDFEQMMSQLDYNKHNFIHKELGNAPVVTKAVSL